MSSVPNTPVVHGSSRASSPVEQDFSLASSSVEQAPSAEKVVAPDLPTLADITAEREQAARDAAKILLPRIEEMLRQLKSDAETPLASQDLGSIRFLLKSLRGLDNLATLRGHARKVALALLGCRCRYLMFLASLCPTYSPNPTDTGVMRERARILEEMEREARAAIRLADLARKARDSAADDVVPSPSRAAVEQDFSLASSPSGHSERFERGARASERQRERTECSRLASGVKNPSGSSSPASHSIASPLPSPKPPMGQHKRRLKAQLHEERKAQRQAEKAQKLQHAAA